MLGTPFAPWQAAAADLICEIDPDTGTFAHSVVCIIVPRRAGKTALTLALSVHRMLANPDYRVAYLAQSRSDAAALWREDWYPVIRGGPLAARLKVREAQGSESITARVHARPSRVRLVAPMESAGHGQANDLVIFDEAWAHTADKGTALEAAMDPTQATRPGSQKLIISAAGSLDSGYLAAYRDLGRDGAPGLAYIEYSADPAADRDNPDTWTAAHPAAGLHVPVDFLRTRRATQERGEFDRAYLGIWPEHTATQALPPALWAACADPSQTSAPRGRAVFALDTNYDRTRTALAAAWPDDDGYRVGIVWTGPTHKARQETVKHAALWRPRAIRYDPLTSGSLALPEWEAVTMRDVQAATDLLMQRVRDRTVRYRPHSELDDAAAAATLRPIGDGGAAFRRSGNASAPLLAAALALLAADRLPSARPSIRGVPN